MSRPHHYLFAHRALPSLFFANPGRFVEACAAEGPAFLTGFWDHVAQSVEEDQRLPSQGLAVEVRPVGDETAVVLVTLPEPMDVPEAWFVAAAYRPPRDGDDKAGALARLFTLEFGMDVETACPLTFLCEWSLEGTHYNLGGGPDPDREAFYGRVAELLAGES